MESLLSFTSFLAQGDTPPPQGNPALPFIMMGLMGVMFYFLLIRPQRKQQKEHQARVAALKIGDKVVTSGGIHGLISNVKDSTVTVKIADNVKIELEKASVTSVAKKSDSDSGDTGGN